jgi:hypothetical protein
MPAPAPLINVPGNPDAGLAEVFGFPPARLRKQSINGVWTRSGVFIEYLSPGVDDLAFGIEDFSCGF